MFGSNLMVDGCKYVESNGQLYNEEELLSRQRVSDSLWKIVDEYRGLMREKITAVVEQLATDSDLQVKEVYDVLYAFRPAIPFDPCEFDFVRSFLTRATAASDDAAQAIAQRHGVLPQHVTENCPPWGIHEALGWVRF